MMRDHIAAVAARHGGTGDVEIEISVDHGEEIARSTWNPRLGILGGLSILGTTGIVVPYSCSAWIDSIRRGVDVARAAGRRHVAGCTGSTSQKVAVAVHGLPQDALLDMGDFAGAVLKHLRRHPVDRLTVAGGFAKLSKLAAGHLDLHSARSQVDKGFLAGPGPAGRGGREAGGGGGDGPTPAWRRSSCAPPVAYPSATWSRRRPATRRSGCCAGHRWRWTRSASTARARSWAAPWHPAAPGSADPFAAPSALRHGARRDAVPTPMRSPPGPMPRHRQAAGGGRAGQVPCGWQGPWGRSRSDE
ncbi:Cobalt-precorrin-5B C(1)-methyltransferase [Streptomyces antimycoticus]